MEGWKLQSSLKSTFGAKFGKRFQWEIGHSSFAHFSRCDHIVLCRYNQLSHFSPHFLDLLVGAFSSSTVVLLKSRPIINVTTSLEVTIMLRGQKYHNQDSPLKSHHSQESQFSSIITMIRILYWEESTLAKLAASRIQTLLMPASTSPLASLSRRRRSSSWSSWPNPAYASFHLSLVWRYPLC